jgi:hypothetical protein
LESESGECDIQLTTAWLLYNIWEVARDTRERQNLREADHATMGLGHLGNDALAISKRLATMRLAELALRVGFQAFAQPLGLFGYKLPDMDRVAEVAHEHYSNDLRGGEGHMEVGKLIVNVVESKCHMTLSVKPFGCMPSSGVSDGVQSLITAKYPGTIFCAVETSGDGATNFYSRVQMYMFKARIAAEQELARAYREQGVTEAEVRAFLDANPSYASSLHHAPHHPSYAGTAANLVAEVAPLLKTTKAERAKAKAKAALDAVVAFGQAAPGRVAELAAQARDPEVQGALRADFDVVRALVTGKAREQFAPLVSRLAKRAYFGDDVIDSRDHASEALAAE